MDAVQVGLQPDMSGCSPTCGNDIRNPGWTTIPMRSELKTWQKLLAYGSLAFVLAWTVFGLYAIWLMLAQG